VLCADAGVDCLVGRPVFVCRNIKHAVTATALVTLSRTHRPVAKSNLRHATGTMAKSEGTAPAIASVSDPNSMPRPRRQLVRQARWSRSFIFGGASGSCFRRLCWWPFSRIYTEYIIPDVWPEPSWARLRRRHNLVADAFGSGLGENGFHLWEKMPSLLALRCDRNPARQRKPTSFPRPVTTPRSALQAPQLDQDSIG